MGNYTDLWKGEMAYYQWFQVGMVGMLLLFVFVQIWYALMGFALYILAFQYFLTERKARKKEKHEGERHLDTHTLREKDYREDKIYSFLRYKRLDLTVKPKIAVDTMPEYKEALCLEITAEQRRAEDMGMWDEKTEKKDEKDGKADTKNTN